MARKGRTVKSSARTRQRAVIVIIAVALALAFLGARVFRVYQPGTGDLSRETSLKPVESIYYQFSGNHIHGLGYDGHNERLFVATHYGIFIWKNGEIFQLGESRDDYMGFSLHPSDPDIVYTSGHPARGGNLGVMKSEDGGASFKQIFRGLRGETVDFHSMTISPANPTILYGSFQGRLYRSKDGGSTWEFAAAQGLPPKGACWGAPCLAADTRDQRTVYAGTSKGLVVSRDFGESWGQMSDPPGAVAGVGIDPSNPHRLFAFADSFGVALSQDGGKSWQARNTGLRLAQHEFIFAFAFDPKDADHVFAATPERVFRTNDGGANWETIL